MPAVWQSAAGPVLPAVAVAVLVIPRRSGSRAGVPPFAASSGAGDLLPGAGAALIGARVPPFPCRFTVPFSPGRCRSAPVPGGIHFSAGRFLSGSRFSFVSAAALPVRASSSALPPALHLQPVKRKAAALPPARCLPLLPGAPALLPA